MKQQTPLDHDFFAQLAAKFSADRPDLDRRHRALLRRQRVLREALRAGGWGRRNPVGRCGFRPPLSVADCPPGSPAFRLADGLTLAGAPIALGRDEKRRHKGTPLGGLLSLLREAGHPADERQALLWYASYMAAHRRVRSRLAATRSQLEACEQAIRAEALCRDPAPTLAEANRASVMYGTSRFMAVVGRADLANLLSHAGDGGDIILSRRPGPGTSPGSLRATPPGESVPLLSGHGEGLASLALDDLWRLACGDGNRADAVAIECLPGNWRGWPDASDTSAKATTFRYGGEGE